MGQIQTNISFYWATVKVGYVNCEFCEISLTLILLNYPESVGLEFSVKPSLGCQCRTGSPGLLSQEIQEPLTSD